MKIFLFLVSITFVACLIVFAPVDGNSAASPGNCGQGNQDTCTPVPTNTFTISPTFTITRSMSPSSTKTATRTITMTFTLQNTGTITYSPTVTRTATPTSTFTHSPTATPTPTESMTPTSTPTPPPTPGAMFKLPRVDVVPAMQGVSATVAVWAFAEEATGAGNVVSVRFPAGTTFFYGGSPPMPSGRDYIPTEIYTYLRYTDVYGTFAAQEVTATAVDIFNSGDPTIKQLNVVLPATIGKGTFYIRFDTDLGVTMPSWPGGNVGSSATLLLYDSRGAPTASAPFYLAPQGAVAGGECVLNGRVVSSIDHKGLPGAMIILAAAGMPVRCPWGPRAQNIPALDLGDNCFAAATDFDGYYSLRVPCANSGTAYQIYAQVEGKNAAGVQTILPMAGPADYTLTNGSGISTATDISFALPR